MKKTNNIFNTDNFSLKNQELIETILEQGDFKVERIVTIKPYEKPGEWYDQEQDEWVLLLQGTASLEFENKEIIKLNSGDYIFIPAHKKHRINHSSSKPQCIWLAIFGNIK